MGVVHLAQAPTAPGSRSRCCARTSSATTRPASGWPARSPRCAGCAARASPRSSTPTRGARRRTSPPATSPGSRCTSTCARTGRSRGDDLRSSLAAGCAEAVIARPPGRRPAPRHQAVQRAASRAARRCSSTSGWPGSPRTRGSPTPAGCSARRATSRPRSSTATTPPPPPTCTPGRRPSCSPRPAGRRSARGPAMAIMDRVRRGEHDLSGVPPALLPLVRGLPRPPSRPTGPPRCGGGARAALRRRRCATDLPLPLRAGRRPSGPPAPTTTPRRGRARTAHPRR